MIPLIFLYLFGPFTAMLLRSRPSSGPGSIDEAPMLQVAAIASSLLSGVLVSVMLYMLLAGPVIDEFGVMVTPPRPVVAMLILLCLYVAGMVLWLLAKDAPRT